MQALGYFTHIKTAISGIDDEIRITWNAGISITLKATSVKNSLDFFPLQYRAVPGTQNF